MLGKAEAESLEIGPPMRRLALVIGLIAGAASVVNPLDVLTLPGVLLAALIWPQGIHTGGGAVPAEIAAQRRRSHISFSFVGAASTVRCRASRGRAA